MHHELVSNRKASHDYFILDTLEAGIGLVGTEIKSLRDHGGSLDQAYVRIVRNEVWLIGAHIAPYRFGNVHNHEPLRDRKLLLHRYEIAKMLSKIQEKGMTLVPLSLYLKKGKVKLLIAVAKGKKHHDKRHSLIEKETRRELDRATKRFRC